MNLVIDTSALLAVLLGEPERNALIRLTRGAVLMAPGSLRWEVGNALIAGLRRKRLTLDQVATAWDSFSLIPLRQVTIAIERALANAHKLGLYAYDAYILEAALAQHLPLLSLDQRLIAAARDLGVEVLEVDR